MSEELMENGELRVENVESAWRESKLDDFAKINPTERLPKGTLAKKIPMEALQPFTKKIPLHLYEEYKGGVKFRNGDTVMARITPSLENGKTSYVDIFGDDEVGFGSTEFIVLREREGVSNSHFLYYLAISPEVRNIAILSMTGSSGRQCVQTDEVKKHQLIVPPLPEQKAIAEILSALDDKIDLLHRQNKTLEQMAETLFRQWFVVEAGEDWEYEEIINYVSVVDNRGKTPPNTNNKTPFPLIEVNALSKENRLVDYSVIRKYVDEDTFNNWFRNEPKKYDTLLSTVGSIGAISMYLLEEGNVAQNVIGLSAKNISPFYLFQALKYKSGEVRVQYGKEAAQ
ncbi:restriction endonuclease subunit S [Desulfobacterota bacterium M19]